MARIDIDIEDYLDEVSDHVLVDHINDKLELYKKLSEKNKEANSDASEKYARMYEELKKIITNNLLSHINNLAYEIEGIDVSKLSVTEAQRLKEVLEKNNFI